MRVYVDVVTLIPTAELWDRSTIIQNCTAKRGDGGVLEVMFHRSGVPELLPVGTVVTYIVKTQGKYDQNPGLCELEIVDRPVSVEEFYTGEPDYNTATLDDELESGDGDDSNDVPFVLGDGEISWLLPDPGAKPKSSLTFPVTVHNDVKKGNEGPPATGAPGYLTAAQSDARYVHAVDGKVPVEQLPDATESAIGASRRATQAEAEAGVQNTAHMTALRVWQAIAAWWTALSVPWAKLTGQPTTLAGYGITDGVPSTRMMSAGSGLTGGGDLSANRSLAVDPATLSDAQTGTNTVKPIVSSVLAGWWSWVKTQAITLGQTSARIFFRLSGSNASNNSPLISMFRSGTSEIVISVQGGGLGNPLVFSVNPTTNNDADLLSSAKFSIGNNGIEAPGTFALGGNFTGNGTNNTLPNQTDSSNASIFTRALTNAWWTAIKSSVVQGFTGVTNGFATASQTIGVWFGVDTGVPRFLLSSGSPTTSIWFDAYAGALRCAQNITTLFTADTNALIAKFNLEAEGNIIGHGTSNTMPNQTAASGPSVMTRDLSDARYMRARTYNISAVANDWISVFEGRGSDDLNYGGGVRLYVNGTSSANASGSLVIDIAPADYASEFSGLNVLSGGKNGCPFKAVRYRSVGSQYYIDVQVTGPVETVSTLALGSGFIQTPVINPSTSGSDLLVRDISKIGLGGNSLERLYFPDDNTFDGVHRCQIFGNGNKGIQFTSDGFTFMVNDSWSFEARDYGIRLPDEKYLRGKEVSSEPAAPPADEYIMFARDNGSGKTQLCVKFATGAVQVLATQP